MNDPATLHTLDIALRAGLATLLLFVAALLLRDHRRSTSARIAAAFAVGVAAHALRTAPGFGSMPPWSQAPLIVVSTGNALVFWLFARLLFDDEFRLQRWHGAAWLVLAGAALVDCLVLAPGPAAAALGIAITLSTLALAVAAVVQTLSTWRGDLVEGRRHLRIFIVGAGSVYTAVSVISNLTAQPGSRSALASAVDAFVLFAIVAVVVWRMLRTADSGLFHEASPPRAAEAAAADVPPAIEPRPDPADARLIAALERLMNTERAYREDGLTIGALAAKLDVPEYKLRRLINQGLGHRNFNSFLNRYRIDEVKAALADPAQAQVPVLTIAMDAGFQSLGPFNRAFKADTGITPTEFRRLGGSVSLAEA